LIPPEAIAGLGGAGAEVTTAEREIATVAVSLALWAVVGRPKPPVMTILAVEEPEAAAAIRMAS
jgi:hypothetical protein